MKLKTINQSLGSTFIKISDRLLPPTLPGRVAMMVFLCFSIIFTYLGQGEGSGIIKMTMPVEPSHRTNAIIGYSFITGGAPFLLKTSASYI